MALDAISSNIDEVLLINPSSIAFVFGDFNDHHKDLLTDSDRPGELCYIFSISSDLTQINFQVNFSSRIHNCEFRFIFFI